jgi:RNA polymerase sigma-70 factor (ECF subfamily)
MRAYLMGDSRAFDTLYHRYSGKVYGYLQRKLRNRESTDDVFQAVFLKFHATRSNYDSRYPVLQWLFVIARTTLADHYRKAARQVQIVDEALDPDRVSQNDPAMALIEEKDVELLKGLPADQRQAVEMRVIDELPYEDIAQKLGRSEASVRQMVSRGLKRLRLRRDLS